MNTFLRFFYEFISVFFDGLFEGLKGLFEGLKKMFSFGEYAQIISSYKGSFNGQERIFVIVSIIILVIVFVVCFGDVTSFNSSTRMMYVESKGRDYWSAEYQYFDGYSTPH